MCALGLKLNFITDILEQLGNWDIDYILDNNTMSMLNFLNLIIILC
jgi:hypothetical protein